MCQRTTTWIVNVMSTTLVGCKTARSGCKDNTGTLFGIKSGKTPFGLIVCLHQLTSTIVLRLALVFLRNLDVQLQQYEFVQRSCGPSRYLYHSSFSHDPSRRSSLLVLNATHELENFHVSYPGPNPQFAI